MPAAPGAWNSTSGRFHANPIPPDLRDRHLRGFCQHARRLTVGGLTTGLLLLIAVIGGCSSNPMDLAPRPSNRPARGLLPPGTAPAGQVLPMTGRPAAAITDGATGSLVVLTVGPEAGSPAALVLVDNSGTPRTLRVARPGHGGHRRWTRDGVRGDEGGIFTVELAGGRIERAPIEGADGTDFTAIARRADGRLGSADGVAYTLAADRTVAEKADIFARVDAIATQGDYAVVLDRAQTRSPR